VMVMHIDGAILPLPSVPEPADPRGRASQPAGGAVSAPQTDTLRQSNNRSTNVLVEMEKGNILVFRFIDEATGQTLQ
jgi:hypothetical protein